jgi:hypothetical protein
MPNTQHDLYPQMPIDNKEMHRILCSIPSNQFYAASSDDEFQESDTYPNSRALSIINKTIHSQGQPLDSETRHNMDQRFGHDFSKVRIHTDTEAAHSAEAISARAYTYGNHIVFRGGGYAPASVDGRRLLAHELTHVIQQRSSAKPSLLNTERPINTYKQMGGLAPEIMNTQLRHFPADVRTVPTPPCVQRQVDSEESEDEKEKRPIKRRRRVLSEKSIAVRLAKLFGGRLGRYRRILCWSWGKIVIKPLPPSYREREVELKGNDASGIPLMGDSLTSRHGHAFYKGQPIAGITEVRQFERSAYISAPVPEPTLAPNETSSIISIKDVVKGTLTYRIGERNDTQSSPKAQIKVERFNPDTGEYDLIHNTGLITTKDAEKEVILDSKLSPDSEYRVRVFAEYWDLTPEPGYQGQDGRTLIDYSFKIQQQTTEKIAITRTLSGKSKTVKKPHEFCIRI